MSFGLAHKFYVSVTHVVYSEKSSSFQITSRIFIDDLEQLLEERYAIDAKLATGNELPIANEYIEKYLRAKFLIELDGKVANYVFLGKEYDNDVVLLYLEVENVNLSDLGSIALQNGMLTDLFDEQQNIVHFKWKGNKKSFVLVKHTNKGMLNL